MHVRMMRRGIRLILGLLIIDYFSGTYGEDIEPPSGVTGGTAIFPDLNSLRFNWGPARDNVAVGGYIIDVATDANFANVLPGYDGLDIGLVKPASVIALELDTDYYTRVRAYDTSGNEGPYRQVKIRTLYKVDAEPPSQVDGITATNISGTAASLSWNEAIDNIKVNAYTLDIATDKDFRYLITGYRYLILKGETELQAIGLQPNTEYYFRIFATDSLSLKSEYSETFVFSTLTAEDATSPAQVTGVTASDVGENSIKLNWNSTSDNIAVTGYQVDVSTSSGFYNFVEGYHNKDNGLSSEIVVENLKPNVYHYVRVRAYDLAGNISKHSVRIYTRILPPTDKERPSTPGGFVATTTETSFTLDWEDSTDNVGIESYQITVGTTGSFTNLLPGYNLKNIGLNKPITISGLTPNKNYYASVAAYDTSWNRSSSSYAIKINTNSNVDSEIPSAPTFRYSSPSDIDSWIGWNSSTDNIGITGYKMDVAFDDQFINFVPAYNDKSLPVVTTTRLLSLTPNTDYFVRVRAQDLAGNVSPNSETFSFQTKSPIDREKPSIVSGIHATNITPTSFTINWDLSTDNIGPVKYQYRISTNPSFRPSGFGNVPNVDQTKFELFSAVNTEYYIQMRTYDGRPNFSDWSETFIVKTLESLDSTRPSRIPRFNGANRNKKDFQSLFFEWAASTDDVAVGGYLIDVSTDKNFTNILPQYDRKDIGNVTEIKLDGLLSSTSHWIRVRAYDISGNISASLDSANLTDPLPVQNVTVTDVTETSLKVLWQADDDERIGGFYLRVHHNLEFAKGQGVNQGKVNEGVATNLVPNTTYYVHVASYTGLGSNISKNNNIISVTTKVLDEEPPSIPEGLSISNLADTSFELLWNASTDNVAVTDYVLDVARDVGFVDILPDYNGVSLGNITRSLISNLDFEATYFVRLRSADDKGNTSDYSTVLEVKTDAEFRTEVGGTINTDTTWTLAETPFAIIGDVVVEAGATLTIEPGVTVKFSGPYALTINGNLVAQGEVDQEIIFTSDQVLPVAGDWKGIEFINIQQNSGIGAHVINHCLIEYATNGVYAEYALPIIQNSFLQNNTNALVLSHEADARVRNNVITENDVGISLTSDSDTQFPRPNITDNTILNNATNNLVANNESITQIDVTIDVSTNWWGLTDEAAIETTILDKDDDPLRPQVSVLPILDVENNNILGDVSIHLSDLLWSIDQSPVLLTGDVVVANKASLTLDEGVEVLVDGAYVIKVDGALLANGTLENPVSLTSNASIPKISDWDGILLLNRGDIESQIQHVDIDYSTLGIIIKNVPQVIE